jgi:hypothetical protein
MVRSVLLQTSMIFCTDLTLNPTPALLCFSHAWTWAIMVRSHCMLSNAIILRSSLSIPSRQNFFIFQTPTPTLFELLGVHLFRGGMPTFHQAMKQNKSALVQTCLEVYQRSRSKWYWGTDLLKERLKKDERQFKKSLKFKVCRIDVYL